MISSFLFLDKSLYSESNNKRIRIRTQKDKDKMLVLHLFQLLLFTGLVLSRYGNVKISTDISKNKAYKCSSKVSWR